MSGVYLLVAIDPQRQEVISWRTGDPADLMIKSLHWTQTMGLHVAQGRALTCPRCGESAMLPNDHDRPTAPVWLIASGGVRCFDCEYDGHCVCGNPVDVSWQAFCSTECEREATT